MSRTIYTNFKRLCLIFWGIMLVGIIFSVNSFAQWVTTKTATISFTTAKHYHDVTALEAGNTATLRTVNISVEAGGTYSFYTTFKDESEAAFKDFDINFTVQDVSDPLADITLTASRYQTEDGKPTEGDTVNIIGNPTTVTDITQASISLATTSDPYAPIQFQLANNSGKFLSFTLIISVRRLTNDLEITPDMDGYEGYYIVGDFSGWKAYANARLLDYQSEYIGWRYVDTTILAGIAEGSNFKVVYKQAQSAESFTWLGGDTSLLTLSLSLGNDNNYIFSTASHIYFASGANYVTLTEPTFDVRNNGHIYVLVNGVNYPVSLSLDGALYIDEDIEVESDYIYFKAFKQLYSGGASSAQWYNATQLVKLPHTLDADIMYSGGDGFSYGDVRLGVGTYRLIFKNFSDENSTVSVEVQSHDWLSVEGEASKQQPFTIDNLTDRTGYYLVGNFSNWALYDANKFDDFSGSYLYYQTNFVAEGDQFKIVYVDEVQGTITWYGMGGVIDAANHTAPSGVTEIYLNQNTNDISFAEPVLTIYFTAPDWANGDYPKVYLWDNGGENLSVKEMSHHLWDGTQNTYVITFTHSELRDNFCIEFYQYGQKKTSVDIKFNEGERTMDVGEVWDVVMGTNWVYDKWEHGGINQLS